MSPLILGGRQNGRDAKERKCNKRTQNATKERKILNITQYDVTTEKNSSDIRDAGYARAVYDVGSPPSRNSNYFTIGDSSRYSIHYPPRTLG